MQPIDNSPTVETGDWEEAGSEGVWGEGGEYKKASHTSPFPIPHSQFPIPKTELIL
jgi:hypothetical protein